ncbi:2' O-ribose methyltransferase [Ascosphaera acerosa]|nr:2' O-ribose methyltransferase [Ascosphaera acerosa]
MQSRLVGVVEPINDRHRIFKPGQSVVDLGFAPGSWSQVAAEMTKPNGRVIGVDIIPAQPPAGVSTIQGNFLLPQIQAYVREYLRNPDRGRYRPRDALAVTDEEEGEGYLAQERRQTTLAAGGGGGGSSDSDGDGDGDDGGRAHGTTEGTVDVVLSDMWDPWPSTGSVWRRSFSDPLSRMMNTSGNRFRDHTGSMDLCLAALSFAYNTVKPGGHFVCKFYQGSEDKDLERRLKRLFARVHREKPESSRTRERGQRSNDTNGKPVANSQESRESFFVALKRRPDVPRSEVFPEEAQAPSA